VVGRVICMVELKKQKGFSGMVSRRIYRQRRTLVENGLADWYFPYKRLEDVLKDLG
jgi:hypothetical protein